MKSKRKDFVAKEEMAALHDKIIKLLKGRLSHGDRLFLQQMDDMAEIGLRLRHKEAKLVEELWANR